jgi:hypothetical protein
VPLATIFVSSLANWAFIGPATTKIMRERKHQGTNICRVVQTPGGLIWTNWELPETRDGRKYYDPGPHSTEMNKLNSAFSSMQ